MKRRQIKGPESCAIATAHILLQVVARSKWQDVETLIANVSQTGRRLVEAQPNELVIANITRRVLSLIRDEAVEDRNDLASETMSDCPMTPVEVPVTASLAQPFSPATLSRHDSMDASIPGTPTGRSRLLAAHSNAGLPKSLFHLLSASPPTDSDALSSGSPYRNSGTSTPTWKGTSSQVHALRSEVIDGIEEIKDEISQVDDQIAALAEVQIHPGDHVLVHQPTQTVERFILRAAQKRKFTLFLAVEPPKRGATEPQYATFRKKLESLGVKVISIWNSGLTAYMSRIDKVVMGAKAIVASGGALVDGGGSSIARAAKEHGNPVIILGGVYKLSPDSPFAEDQLIEWGDSSTVVSFENGPIVNEVTVRTAVTELVPPGCIDTYITNLYVLGRLVQNVY